VTDHTLTQCHLQSGCTRYRGINQWNVGSFPRRMTFAASLRKRPDMPPRSSWKGYLRVSLVSIPLKAYTASSSAGDSISLNQLHAECNSRINYKKTCPIHGEIPNNEIVSGYQYAKDQYVIIDVDELDKLRLESDQSISVEKFVPADEVDPIYVSGKTYYLVPDGPVGQKPYALLQRALSESGLNAIARVVLSKKEQVVRLRSVKNLLAMDVLQYDSQVKHPEAFNDELVPIDPSKDEMKLVKMLVDAMTSTEFNMADYPDEYTQKLTQLVELKVEGKELVTPPPVEAPAVINLMDALKESVKRVKTADAKPPRKVAARTGTRDARKAGGRKSKSG
jgi:DNA end-binding protein Ku